MYLLYIVSQWLQESIVGLVWCLFVPVALTEYFVMGSTCGGLVNVLDGCCVEPSVSFMCVGNERAGLGLQWTRTWYREEVLAKYYSWIL